MSGITVTGRVLKTEHRKGGFNDKSTGERIEYDFHLARVLVDDSDVVEVKFRNDRPDVPVPNQGDVVSLSVELPGNSKVIASGYARTAGK